ncbi:UbiD family decarboxylase [Archaeoglobales archaeon]|nr:MAG: UbiD family decarboxylase [Archaeoglobales archaeon]
MNLRDAMEQIEFIKIDKELKHDEVLKFIKDKNHEKQPLLLNVEGKKVAKNFIATRELLCKYLGVRKEDLAKHLSNFTPIKKIDILESGLDLESKKVNLYDLPILRYYKGDGGRYVTAGVVIARKPNSDYLDTSSYNASIHRLMLIDENKFAARLVPPRHTYLLWREAIEENQELPVAIVVGVHPLFLFAASTRVPEGMEFKYAAWLMGGLKLYEVDKMLVPDAEIVLIGRITAEKVKEGPFVDITGTYDKVRDEPVVEIDKMYCKKNPIYYSIIPGGSEHQILMGIPFEPVIYKTVSNVCKVKNVVMTAGSKHYLHCVVQIEKETQGDGKNAIIAALSAHPSMKGVVVVDDDINIYSYEDVEFAIATRFQADRDFVMIKNARGSSLDPSSNATTTKWGIDATKYFDRREDFERIEE